MAASIPLVAGHFDFADASLALEAALIVLRWRCTRRNDSRALRKPRRDAGAISWRLVRNEGLPQ